MQCRKRNSKKSTKLNQLQRRVYEPPFSTFFYNKCSFLHISDWLINRLNKNIVCLTWRASLPIRLYGCERGEMDNVRRAFPATYMNTLCGRWGNYVDILMQHVNIIYLNWKACEKSFCLYLLVFAGENEHKEGIERERGGGINIACNYMQHFSFGQHETFIYFFLSPRWYPDTLNIWFK